MAISVTGLDAHTQVGSGTWQDYGSGGGSSTNTTLFVSSTSSRARKFTGVKGFGFEINAAGESLANSIVMVRFLLNGGFGSALAAGGGLIRLEDTSGNQSDFYVSGSDTYPGGWQVVMIDTSQTESANNGTAATLTAIQYAGMVVDAAAASGGDPNFYIDEVISMPNTGLTLAGNTTNLFNEAAAWDLASFYGAIELRGGVVFSKVPLILSPDASDHASVDELLVFEELVYEDGTNVDSAATLLGLTSADADTITLTRLTAVCDANGDITGTSADKELDFASATDIVATDCTFRGFDGTTTALGGSGNDYTGVTFQACSQITDTGAVLRSCTFRNTTDADGAYGWTTSSDLESSEFISDGTGHGIDFISAPTDPAVTTFTDLIFTGYGANDTADAATDNNTAHDILIDLVGATTGVTVNTTTNTSTQQSAPIDIEGLTWGSAVTVHAAETVGTLTDGDLLSSGFADLNGEYTYNLPYEGAFDPSGLDVTIRARNYGIPVAAIAEEDGVGFTDETSESSSNATADMTLLPSTWNVDDAYYFGHDEEFAALKLVISTAAASTSHTILWEYWNGAWVSLSGVTDGTSGFGTTGENEVDWTLPGDWAVTTVNSQGPLYYVRARVSAASSPTTAAVGSKASLDATRYLPYVRLRTVLSAGVTDVVTWVPDAIGQF